MLKCDDKTGDWIYRLGEWCLKGSINTSESSKVKFSTVENRFYKMRTLIWHDREELANINCNFRWISKVLLSLRYYAEKDELVKICNGLSIVYKDISAIVIRKYHEAMKHHLKERKIHDQMFLFQTERFEDGLDYEFIEVCKTNTSLVVVKNAFDEQVAIPMECCEPIK